MVVRLQSRMRSVSGVPIKLETHDPAMVVFNLQQIVTVAQNVSNALSHHNHTRIGAKSSRYNAGQVVENRSLARTKPVKRPFYAHDRGIFLQIPVVRLFREWIFAATVETCRN